MADLTEYERARAEWLAARDAASAALDAYQRAVGDYRDAVRATELASHAEQLAYHGWIARCHVEERLWDAMIDATPRPAVEGTPYEQT